MKLRTSLILSYLVSLLLVTVVLFVAYKHMFLDYERLQMAMLITVASSILSLVINAFFIFPMAKGISRLSEQSHAIAQGNYDFPVSSSKTKELQELSESLHHMSQDIKSKIEALQLEENRRSELIANLSHDIKTPLASIRSYSEALIDGIVQDPDKMKTYLLGIGEQTERVVSFANELFAITAIDQRAIAFKVEQLWIDHLLVDVLQSFEPQITLENRMIDINLNAENLWLYSDKTCMERILCNLLSNALKFSQPGTRIQINVISQGDRIRFEIQDEGIGISEDKLQRIFERFYRVEESRNPNYGGSGIGLSIAMELTEMLGGQIQVTSQYGVGSQFTLIFPKKI
ncbi:HAMP domain-containing sensor histidine kinase [Paenibacillus sp. UMB7766-LJ446]|nr:MULTISPECIES: HAMP domain-containing sensor histidine kinase [unclassified Paenibacillus]KGP78829.1 signal transduction histidine kinase [Paenibacillus sp. MAEPY2]KGP88691.1 signal transduction histidine kinase [Paenibacillus sp. MAEPY1]MDK8189687.1 HAMP domain-containing sensor histidine kinase [Paenibacillus sp. UMB7766-LJ446]